MSYDHISESLSLLQKNWSIDPILVDFMLGTRTDVTDHAVKVGQVIFHIPYLTDEKKFILWKCYWPDCHNCCERQGRLPLTSDDLIVIGKGLKYQRISDFVKNERLVATWMEYGPSGNNVLMTSVNVKRKTDETESDDGTHIRCRFLDEKGACSMHPNRPGALPRGKRKPKGRGAKGERGPKGPIPERGGGQFFSEGVDDVQDDQGADEVAFWLRAAPESQDAE